MEPSLFPGKKSKGKKSSAADSDCFRTEKSIEEDTRYFIGGQEVKRLPNKSRQKNK